MLKRFRLASQPRLATFAGSLLLAGVAWQTQAADFQEGLTAYWNFDDNDFRDVAGNYDGIENGTEPIAFVEGKPGFGQAIQLDGVDQMVEIGGDNPDDLAFEGGSMSLSVWFRVEAFDKSWQALVAKGEGNNWRTHRRGDEAGMAYAGGQGDTPTGAFNVDDGEWHHMVAMSDPDAVNFGTAVYVDGQPYSQLDTAPSMTANGQPVMIGENPDARGRYWNGDIDDVALWDRLLTESEIAALYNNGAGVPLSNLLVVVDTDEDGMPDWWEVQYGFDPEDPADAALDCNGNGLTNLQEYEANLDPCDDTRPLVVSAMATSTFDGVTVTFSKDLDAETAVDVANYSITPDLEVTAASYRNKVVTLTTAAQTPGGVGYTVTVTGVKDKSQFEIPEGSNTAKFFSYMVTTDGVLKFSYWGDIGGTAVTELLNDARYPNSPDWVGAVYSFNSRDIFPDDSNDNYGATIEGWVTPTETDDYWFFLRSDDASELWISTDDTEANLIWWAEETDCCDAFMEPDTGDPATTWMPLRMEAGQSYFLRVIYKEGGGGDYAQVAWRKDGDSTPAADLQPIPGMYLSVDEGLPAPAEGEFVTQDPAPGATGILPDAGITIVHRDGLKEWTEEGVSLMLDGEAVDATFSKEGNVATLTYQPTSLAASGSMHTISLGYEDPAGDPATLEWSYETAVYGGPLVDEVMNRPAILLGEAQQSADMGGHTGTEGDYALDLGTASGVGYVSDVDFISDASADDTLTIAFYQKLRSVRNSSALWVNSPSSNNATRGFQAHVPWGDSNIYFDTSGCCEADTQRINADINNFNGYTGDPTWWEDWHHFAFVKDGSEKRIYIDGLLFHWGGGDPLMTDFTNLVMGGGSGITDNRMDGLLDDFVIYDTALSDAQAATLASGAEPSSIDGLIAHWDYNDEMVADVSLMVTLSGNQIIVDSEPATLPAGWVIQTATSIEGPWTTEEGATTPYTMDIGADNAFIRTSRE